MYSFFIEGYLRTNCVDKETSVIVPYISDVDGIFLSDFNQDEQYSTNNLYLSFKWKDDLYVLDLYRSLLSPQTASLEWNENNITVATPLYYTHSYQGSVVGDTGSLAALAITDGVVSIAS